MLKRDAIEYFGSKRKVALAAQVSRQAVQKWGDLIPALPATRLERASGGRLAFDPAAYPSRDKKPLTGVTGGV